VKLSRPIAVLASLAVCAACASRAAAPKPPPAEPAAAPVSDQTSARPPAISEQDVLLTERAIAAFEELSAAVVSAGGDCQKATAALAAVPRDVRARLAAADALDRKLRSTPAGRDWLERTYGERLRQAGAPLVATTCLDDAAFADALGELTD
jgi:hypothetical protein